MSLSNILSIPNPPSHDIRVIVVASESLDVEKKYNKLIDRDKNEFEILDRFSVPKDGPFPSGLMLLAVGKDLIEEYVWKVYPNSDFLFFYIVKVVKK